MNEPIPLKVIARIAADLDRLAKKHGDLAVYILLSTMHNAWSKRLTQKHKEGRLT